MSSQEMAIVIDDESTNIAINPLDIPTTVFKNNLARRSENRQLLLNWIRSSLKEGIDYGSIPTKRGPSKPSLFKPGAEKICGMLGITVHFPSLKETEQAFLQGLIPEYVMVRCELKNIHGQTLADGVGARSLKQDYGDLNKALKMASKSAHIDATLRLAGLSEVFTQDTEDMTNNLKKMNENKPSTSSSTCITEAQYRELSNQLNKLNLDKERFIAYCNKIASAKSLGSIRSLNELPVALFDFVMKKLPELSAAA
ncbi:hypothetical protein CKO12_13665 [Chromatium okenii]|uniref:hypothetical protein n=1 Tax=Chromatium okenii TaxID=61644 RepID=UPI0019083970|nr:hypothetical protein [Chromatium okenii]MBK1642896.1 hypothetical protein [Chromatium okenii]